MFNNIISISEHVPGLKHASLIKSEVLNVALTDAFHIRDFKYHCKEQTITMIFLHYVSYGH